MVSLVNSLKIQLASNRGIHLSLIDIDKEFIDPISVSQAAIKSGTDALIVGGSTGTDPYRTSQFVKLIRKNTDCSIFLMPSPTCPICDGVDGVFFFWLPQAQDLYLSSCLPALAAPILKRYGVVIMPTGYLIFQPGMTVAKILRADPLPRDRVSDISIGLALASQAYGHKLLWLEAGSGAPEPIDASVVRAIRKTVDIPIITGGGIRTPNQAKTMIEAGADIVVTGNLLETNDGRSVIKTVHETERKRIF